MELMAALTLLSAVLAIVGTRMDARRFRPSRSDDRAYHRTWARWAARIARKPLLEGGGNCDPGLARHRVVPEPAARGRNVQVDRRDVAATSGVVATTSTTFRTVAIDKSRFVMPGSVTSARVGAAALIMVFVFDRPPHAARVLEP
jgi:hypothetical protein